MHELEGQVAVVTGASRGIGRAVALALAEAGATVAVNYLTHGDAAAQVVESIRAAGGTAAAYQADVSDPEKVQTFIAAVEGRFGKIDILVNNAGHAESGLLQEISIASWRRMMAVHLDGAFYCTRLCLPGMIRRRYGRIVNIASIWGITGAANEVAYSAAKAGLAGFTRALALEVAPSGITVNAVAPGVIDTDMNRGYTPQEIEDLQALIPAGRLGTPEEIAAVVRFLCSPQASYITGQVLSPNGGLVTT